jgi:hypothetical protein
MAQPDHDTITARAGASNESARSDIAREISPIGLPVSNLPDQADASHLDTSVEDSTAEIDVCNRPRRWEYEQVSIFTMKQADTRLPDIRPYLYHVGF